MEHEGVFLALKYQPQVQTAAAFHEGLDATQADSSVQVRVPVCRDRGLHRGQNLCAPVDGNASKEARRSLKLHGARSASPVITRNLPARRACAASLRMTAPALALWAGVRPYSEAK